MVWVSLVLLSCVSQGPCEEQKGRCTRTDVECGAKFRFVGYDPSCGEPSKCCVPLEGASAPVDAGQPCERNAGKCQSQDLPCGAGTVAIGFDDVCGSGNQCCAKALTCAQLMGRCSTSCTTNEAIGFNARDCASNQVCCSPR